jgi:hypothetical protein
LLTGSPTNWKREKAISATVSITTIACIKRRRIKTNMDFAKASKAARKGRASSGMEQTLHD